MNTDFQSFNTNFSCDEYAKDGFCEDQMYTADERKYLCGDTCKMCRNWSAFVCELPYLYIIRFSYIVVYGNTVTRINFHATLYLKSQNHGTNKALESHITLVYIRDLYKRLAGEAKWYIWNGIMVRTLEIVIRHITVCINRTNDSVSCLFEEQAELTKCGRSLGRQPYSNLNWLKPKSLVVKDIHKGHGMKCSKQNNRDS